MDSQPKPYVPLGVHAHEYRQPQGRHVRPWMLKRGDETVAAWTARTNHSCYRCGAHIADMRGLDEHETCCRALGPGDADTNNAGD